MYKMRIDPHPHRTLHLQAYLLTMLSLLKSLCLSALAPLALAAAVPSTDAELVDRDTACSNGPYTRECWHDGYR